MDGIHDLGGKQGFGVVQMEKNEPVFHYSWEAKVFSFVLAGLRAGAWNNTDKFRHAIERIDPVSYLTNGYYGRWLAAVETLLLESGVVNPGDLEKELERMGVENQDGYVSGARPLVVPDPLGVNENMLTASRTPSGEPLFGVGDKVFTSKTGHEGHTRLPSYARGKNGLIIAVHGSWVYPDTNAHGKGEQPQFLYTVEFSGEELWGEACDHDILVSLDLFEPYLSRS
ncbi:MAG: nitrile hydratase subunit beta [Gammaproteobacteria bacterium]|nr:nitrile hydratase subunit beta [Gammaproteobacteria bacterium]